MKDGVRCTGFDFSNSSANVIPIPGTTTATTFALIDFPDRRISYRNADETTRRWSASVSCLWKHGKQPKAAKKALSKCVSLFACCRRRHSQKTVQSQLHGLLVW